MSKAQAKGAPMMLRLSIRPRRAPAFAPGKGEATTDGNTSRMRASACCGGVTPVTACIRSPAMSSVPWSILDYLKFVFIDTNERRFAKAALQLTILAGSVTLTQERLKAP